MTSFRTGLRAAAVALLPLAALVPTAAALAQQARPAQELIPRKDLFGNPSRTAATVSPDGKSIAFLAPKDGVMNVWVAPLATPDKAKPLTQETLRPIRSYFWAPDSSQILYIQDKGGDENFLLYGVDLAKGETRTLTPFEKTRVQVIAISETIKDAILVGVNNRDPRWHDVHRLNLKTGELTLVRQNDGYAGFAADDTLTLRLATKATADGGYAVETIGPDGTTAPFLTIPHEDGLTSGALGFTTDGKTLYLRDSRGRDTSALFAMDMASGRTTLVAENAKADIGGLMANPRTGVVEAYSAYYETNEWFPVGDALKADIAFLNEKAGGEWSVTSRDDADRIWTVAVDRVTEAPAFYLYDRKKKALTRLFTTRPELEGRTLATMHPVQIPSRDGLTLVSYLTLPPGSDKDGDGKPETPVPLVLSVHGGPWARDGYGYNGTHQWLANRGYAVLSVNFRGSTGFGKGFVNAGNLEWGRKMHDDLIDGVDWAVKQGVTTADKVAIMGGSYGGYATLWGMTATPDRFACGVSIVGPSNLITLLGSIPPYWASVRENFARRMGDDRTEEGRALLTERSPLSHVQNIRKPLLIGQGANDPRVIQRESDQIVAAMKEKGIPVTYVLYPDEGHGFARPQNRISFNAVTEAFLSRCLGGAHEPVGTDFDGASLTVPEGAQGVPGVAEALAAKK
ncbi:S9 family peptidase [Rhodospirillum centenum]|uniref:Dipeptidyl anminopeptidase, putative n=1 Tax=Rhodospirillum centenum (strain ATCC 51521 / SW) TaxID=414684 RepID=B6IYQ3_RHOCS|nr:S9 family peptidase [Rhodospirillum centenum]ACJ01427.1 dipeptidyl anminopeptidase, putative [Rhodospirillum centenum SW]